MDPCCISSTDHWLKSQIEMKLFAKWLTTFIFSHPLYFCFEWTNSTCGESTEEPKYSFVSIKKKWSAMSTIHSRYLQKWIFHLVILWYMDTILALTLGNAREYSFRVRVYSSREEYPVCYFARAEHTFARDEFSSLFPVSELIMRLFLQCSE